MYISKTNLVEKNNMKSFVWFCPRYELIQKGITELRDGGIVPDVYTQNMLLENENKILKKDLKHYKQAAEYVIFK